MLLALSLLNFHALSIIFTLTLFLSFLHTKLHFHFHHLASFFVRAFYIVKYKKTESHIINLKLLRCYLTFEDISK